MRKAGYNISTQDIKKGFSSVCETTGLSGRWQKINNKPRTICDTGHNEGGFRYISEQLKNQRDQLPSGGQLHIVFGMVNDKDVSTVLSLLPTDAKYYFTKASTKRARKRTCSKSIVIQSERQMFLYCWRSLQGSMLYGECNRFHFHRRQHIYRGRPFLFFRQTDQIKPIFLLNSTLCKEKKYLKAFFCKKNICFLMAISYICKGNFSKKTNKDGDNK